MSSNRKLYAYVVGHGAAFSVPLDDVEDINDMKKAILKEKPNDLKDIDADRLTLQGHPPEFDSDQLTLYKVRLVDDNCLRERASEELAKLREKKGSVLQSTRKLSKYFDDTYWHAITDDDGIVHVLVEIPDGAGECFEPRT
jgi:hypothetical protein